MKNEAEITILVDTREQLPYDFARFVGGEIDIILKSATLPEGDYAIDMGQPWAIVERKSLSDLITCLSGERDRFERELFRLRAYPHAWVIVEGNLDQIVLGQYRSQMSAMAVVATIAAFSVRYIPILFAGNRETAEMLTWQLLCKAAREVCKMAKMAKCLK